MNDRDRREAQAIVEEFGLGEWTGDASVLIRAMDERGWVREPSTVLDITGDFDQRIVLRNQSDGMVVGEGTGDTYEAAVHAALRRALEAERSSGTARR